MNKLFEYLKRPAPINGKPWYTITLSTTIAIAILAIFEPFAFRLNSTAQLIMLLGFALLVFVVATLFFIVFPLLFKSYFVAEKWTLGRMYLYICFFLLFSGFGVFIYEYMLVGNHTSDEYWTKEFFTIFFIDMLAAVSIGLIPITISTFIAKNRELKRNLQEATKLNELLSHRLKKDETTDMVMLEGSTKDSITVDANTILYIEAAGNYVNIVYLRESGLQKKMLRSTIKQVEEILQPYVTLIRCHRAFIVNINQIASLSGNAQGYKLAIHHTEEQIPVSRTYMKQLKESLT